MLLAVDCGNTNVVFALFEGRDIRARWRIATDARRTGDEYAVWLSQLLAIEGIDRSAVSAMIVSSVVPRARHNLEVLGEKSVIKNPHDHVFLRACAGYVVPTLEHAADIAQSLLTPGL